MLRLVSRGPVVVALLLVLSFASNAAASPERAPAFRDTIVSASAPRALQTASEWGGPTTATDGETVKLYFSDAYPVDPARALQWADFMTSLVHGPELQTVAIHLAPLNEVQRHCGGMRLPATTRAQRRSTRPRTIPRSTPARRASSSTSTGTTSREPREPALRRRGLRHQAVGLLRERLLAHAGGRSLLGAEDSRHYMLNPGEAYAEAYRVLNEQKLGLAQES